MEITHFITKEQREILELARKTYGDTNQILVSVEELCELASVCTKYPRYDNKEKALKELQARAVDEVADVLIVLDHIINVFKLYPEDITKRVEGKINRLQRWLATSDRLEQSTKDREVAENVPCVGCKNFGDFKQLKIGGKCYNCQSNDFANREEKESPNDETI